mmetsp:Transcript_31658/g.69186  ORF Transcript_31658/g.69186 Transcript_31658/m.69186 type:complete len:88 (+) Transcript_31658:103-366(+)
MATKVRWSGLQRQVFNFHRAIIRTTREKEPEMRAEIMKYAREQFDTNKLIDRKDVMRIEYLLRKGAKQLELAQEPNFAGIKGGAKTQ